jgi:hypothetical protein
MIVALFLSDLVSEIGGVTYLCEIKRPKSSFVPFPCTADTSVASATSPVPGAANGKLDTGPHTLRVRMKDAAGNIGIYHEFSWIIGMLCKHSIYFVAETDLPLKWLVVN